MNIAGSITINAWVARTRKLAIGLLSVLAFAPLHAQPVQTPAAKTVASGFQFPEGTIFVGDTLYFVDYGQSAVLRLVDGAPQVVWQQNGCGANGLVQSGHDLLVACYDSHSVAEVTTDGRTLGAINTDDRGNPLNHPNDLTSDRHGGVYFTASGSADTPGKAFYLDAAHRAHEIATDIRYANGVALSPDGGTLYIAESDASRILAFTIDAPARLSNRRVFATQDALGKLSGNPRFTPDGVRVDAQGNVFVAQYDGGGFVVFSRDGQLQKTVRLPGEHHSNLAISPDGRSVFVTAVQDGPGGTQGGALLQVPNPARP
jgi:gluconolactonase